MPDVQEVFRMATQKVRPDAGALERQRRDQRRHAVKRGVGVYTLVAGLVAGLVVAGVLIGLIALRKGDNEPSPAGEPTAVDTGEAGAVDVARGFLDAFGALDADRAISYLADGASIQLDATTPEELRLLFSFYKAQGFKQMLGPCGEPFQTASGTHIRCPYSFHALRSDEIGRGPYHGSYWDVTVREGEIVEVSSYFEIEKFSPQMWEPFRDWIHAEYPKDYEVMYCCGGSNFRLTKQSIRLWGQHTREYVIRASESG
jgi:hypothetical protein